MNLFAVIAGKSEDTFKMGGVTFMAAPVTMREYAEFTALPEGEVEAWIADKLKRRLSEPTKVNPDTITAEWLRDNLPMPYVKVVQHILLYGKMPEDNEKKAP